MNGPPPPLVRELAELGYALMHALFQEAKEALGRQGLSLQRAHFLGLLAQGVDAPSMLAALLEASPSQVSHLVAALEREGLVERQVDPLDRRRFRLSLTAKGEEIQKRAQEVWLNVFAKRLARLSPEEVQAFRDILVRLVGGAHG